MHRLGASIAAAVLVSLAVSASASADGKDPINGYRVPATAENLEKLALAGFDVTEGRRGSQVEIFGTARQAAKLGDQGIKAKLVRDAKGRTASRRQKARIAQAGSGDAQYRVWRRYDRVPGDGKEQYLELYDRLLKDYPKITKKVVLGQTHQGRDMIAIKVSRGARRRPDGSRPAVLYNAQQHAREWLAGETCRRTLEHVVTSYGDNARISRLVETRELWFMCISNPDGFEYTFTSGNRLWRKNMADNDGDGVRGEFEDGVDLNRNFARNWGRDDEGSSSDPTSETYRGTAPDSEPETRAMRRLCNRVDFAFQKNDHTSGPLILWPQGFQKDTMTPDNAIFEALAGDDASPAIKDDEESFDPDLSSELYITNGDTLDDGYHSHGILGFTLEGTPSRVPGVTGFEFEDDEVEVQQEFERHLKFALDLADSAGDPERPESHLDNTTEDFYVDRFGVSYGDPQTVQVTARRSLGPVFMKYRINGGNDRRVRTTEFEGGERYYQDTGVYYHRMRGEVVGTKPGDQVRVWFENRNGKRRSPAFTYEAKSENRRRVLIVADENYSGPVPDQEPGPHYASSYQQALQANGISADVYDVDANDTTAPHPLGVLSHYDAVVWETGDDYVTRRPGQMPATGAARAALETQLAVRDFLNEGGKLIYSGKNAGRQFAEGFEFRNFGFPEPDEGPGGEYCNKNGTDADPSTPDVLDPWPETADGCILLNNDFLQYYLGAYLYVSGGNATGEDGKPLPVEGFGAEFPFGPDGADNQDHTATLAVTSSILDPEQFPLFADSERLGAWKRSGPGPFSPFTGSQYMSAAAAEDQAYKRLRRTVDLTGKTAAELSFRMSADTEQDWDYAFVEAREVGTENWTTLPEKDGLTSQSTGQSCPSGWGDQLHPQLKHYQTVNADGTCSPTGTTGAWHAFSGNSGGWQEWNIDLSAYAGKQVELAISYVSDWSTTNLGVWVDDAKVTADGATLAETSFESDLGGWEIGPPPEGTPNARAAWQRTTEQFQEGPVVGTTDTVYTSFGFEGLAGPAQRNEFMRGALQHLGLVGAG